MGSSFTIMSNDKNLIYFIFDIVRLRLIYVVTRFLSLIQDVL